jgi:tetratricopeptide (TPR) repeat protein/tRNA A-37 threonylcarbamoyl transferase component Bud32
MPELDCLTEADLRAFQLGELPADVADVIAVHLESCPTCAARAEQFDPVVDPCIAHLRAAVGEGTLTMGGLSPEATTDNDRPPPPTAPDRERFPRPFGGYELLSELGRGGMSVVYLARQHRPARTVALKLILAGSHAGADRRARFLAEADAIGRLQHPRIVQIYEVGEHDGQLFLALEYVDGGSLAALLGGKPQDPAAAAGLAEKVARAVHYAHESGVVHRDLKPANILLASPTEPKIADFGLAKQDEVQLTASSALLGTPAYMAPEQAAGDNRAVGPATDIHALGAILYEMLAGQPPFRGASALEVLEQVRTREPVLPRQARVPLDLSTICLKCLDKEPSRRYGSALELAEDLSRFVAGEPIRARPVGTPERLWRWVARNPTWAATLAAVALLLLLGTAFSTWQAVRATNAEADARRAEADAWQAEKLATQDRDKAVKAEADAKLQRDLAVTARNQAEAQKKRADDEAAFARDVSRFLRNDLLLQASPLIHANVQRSPDKDIKLRTILDRASEQIAGRFPGRPLVEAAIRATIGTAYFDLGEYDLALPHLQAAHAIYLDKKGSDDVDTLTAQNNLAELHFKQGQYLKAEALHLQTLEVRRRKLGDDHLDTLQSMHNLAALHKALGKYASAEPLYLKALEACRRKLGDDHLHTLQTQNNLAALYHAQGQYARAEPLYLETLAACRQKLGVEHRYTLLTQNNLAALYADQGQYAQAGPLYLKTLQVQRQQLGETHPDTLATYHNLAGLFKAMGQYAKAEKLYLQTLAAQRQKLGDDHPSTLQLQNHLAQLYAEQYQYARAEALYLQTCDLLRQKLGEDHPDTLESENNLAQLYYRQGLYGKAEPLQVRILEIRRQKLGDDHPDTLAAQNNLALTYKAQRLYAKAEPLYLKTLQARQKRLGAEHPETLSAQNNLAVMYLAQGRYDEAEPLCLKTLEVRLKNLGNDHPSTLTSQNNLAFLYEGQGQFARAEALYLTTLDARKKKLGANHADTLMSQHNLAALYLVQGKCAAAEPLLAEMEEPCRLKMGDKHPLTRNVQTRLQLLPQLRATGEHYQKTLAAQGPDHPDTLAARLQWAAVLRLHGLPQPATLHLKAVIESWRQLLGTDDSETFDALQQLAAVRFQSGKQPEAIDVERRVLEVALRARGERDPFTQWLAADLLWLYKQQQRSDPDVADIEALLSRQLLAEKKYAAAEALLSDCLKIREKHLADDWSTFVTQGMLGAALLGQQQYADAEPLLLAGYQGMIQRAAMMPRRWRLASAIEIVGRLVELYEMTGQKQKAEQWRKKL